MSVLGCEEDVLELDGLPDDVVFTIAATLRAKDLSKFAQVNARLARICREDGLWRALCERDFGVRDGSREIYLMLVRKLNCFVNFRERKPVYTGFDAVHIGRGVRFNEYDNSSHHFIYPVPSGALFLVFTLPMIPEKGLYLSVKHKEYYPRNEAGDQRFGAFVDIVVNEFVLLNQYSPQSEEYKIDRFELPSCLLRRGRNTIRWNYRIGSAAFYWIQEAQLTPPSRFT